MIINPYAFVGSGPVLWTPLNLASPATLGLDDSSTMTDAGGGACSQWDDLTGNGYNVTQGSGTDQPLITPGDLNGLPVLTFDGLGDNFQIPSAVSAASMNVGSLWCFAVYKNTTSSAAVRNLFGISTNAANTIRFAMQTSRTSNTNRATLGVRRTDAASFTSLSATTNPSTNWTMAMVRMSYTDGDGFVDVNGVLSDASNLSLTSTGITSNTTPASVGRIGSGVGTSGNSADMKLAALWFGVGLPTSTPGGEVDKMFGYYAHRYALTSLLDGAHPYKTNPPTV